MAWARCRLECGLVGMTKKVGIQVLMAQIVSEPARDVYLSDVEVYCRDIQKSQKALYTPGGLVYLDEWGAIRYALNSAFICVMVSDLTKDAHAARRFHKWSQSQVDYVLGAKNNGFSFMVGFGKKYPLRPHHRGASCPKKGTIICNYSYAETLERNPIVLWGAIVGGPDRHDGYKDERLLYKQSEVALDFNAGFQSTVVGVLHHIIIGAAPEVYKYSTFTPPEPTTVSYNTTIALPETTSSKAHKTFNILLFTVFYLIL